MTTSNELRREFEVEEQQGELEERERDVTSPEPRKLGPQQPVHVISYNMEEMNLGL